ncbi:MAG: tRNA (adenosine(37)-N6)-dimethylallyltransferase MiaA [Bacteroidales bacterium]
MQDSVTNPLLVILGPTASGKTNLAAHAAFEFGGELISADSRQVYRQMNIGTGKDLQEFNIQGTTVRVHLLDLHPPGYKYNVYEYQSDFLRTYAEVRERGCLPVMCGGSGLYIEAVLSGYQLVQVPVNEEIRRSWDQLPDEELIARLTALKPQHNTTDIGTRKRLVRALEIALYEKVNPEAFQSIPQFNALLVGVRFPRTETRERITRRLYQRLSEGMVEEVKLLLESGISPEDLVYYGLEYKFITQYLLGQLSYENMVERLNTAIHQFAKRQMTWFRKMEREGHKIHWIPGDLPLVAKLNMLTELLHKKGIH